jgi:hypothetical protein
MYVKSAVEAKKVMSIIRYTQGRVDWSELSIWRRITLVACLAAFLYLGQGYGYEHIKIYYSAPDAPEPSIHKTVPVHVMHNSLKFVTKEEADRLEYWRNRDILVGVPFAVAFLTLATSRRQSTT